MATYKGRHCIAGTGATGAQGIQGNKGDKGDAATVAVNSTVTLAPGSQAKVENEGDSHNAKFKFSIPRGDKGEKGDNATITIGSVTKGTDPAVTNSGTATNAVLNITLPKGDTGVSVSTVTPYYLATSQSQGITKDSSGWTNSAQLMSSVNKYLWCYHKFTFTNNTTTSTNPVVIGVYGDKGDRGTTDYNDLTNKPIVNGVVSYQSDINTKQLRNIRFATEEPKASDGINGDIWVVFSDE